MGIFWPRIENPCWQDDPMTMTPETLRALRVAATCSAHGISPTEALSLIEEVKRLQALTGRLRSALHDVYFGCDTEDDHNIDGLLEETGE
jgi:hypothetical protein